MPHSLSEDIEETMNRIQHHSGVSGIIMTNAKGIPQFCSGDSAAGAQYANEIGQLLICATSVVRDLEPANDLTFLRLRSKKQEIMVANDPAFNIIVIQQRE